MDDPDRVIAYLEDKLQTPQDLEQLDHLLHTIHAQHALLKQQLHAAHRDLSDAKHAARDHHQRLDARARAFNDAHADLDRRLPILAADDTSDHQVPRFEPLLDALQRLDVATAYLDLLHHVAVLSQEAQSLLQTSDHAALAPYKQLRALHARLQLLQDDAEGAAPQLLHHLDHLAHALRADILHAFSARLETVLTKAKWPTPKATITSALLPEWERAVLDLLDLQSPELDAVHHPHADPSKTQLPAVLFPMHVLVQPLELRFRYHFDGDKPTNRIDRPEYFLSHITTLLNDYSGFVVEHMQPLLLKQFRATPLALNPIYIDAMSAFITALLPMLRAKIATLLPKVAAQPQLLSHLMHELMSFDTTLREEWRYDGGYGVEGWKGLSWEFLVQGDWFARWLQVEKDFALARYQSIVEAPDFGHLDYESVDPKATKPTKGAIRVNDLLETVTDRYRPLTSFTQKLRFLIDIQITIFDKLEERLRGNLEAYLTLTTSLGRAMGGVSKEEQDRLLGIEGLERLCKTYGSADYLERAMRDWSDDVFFLDIWDELQDRARRAGSIGAMSVADVAERTSKAVGGDGDGGALFDETAAAYSRLRIRSEKIITDTVNSNVREALRAYRHINPWATLSSSSSALSSTAELDPLIAYLTTTLVFLSRALAPAPLRRIARGALATVSTTVWDNVISRHRFSTAGAAQLSSDLHAVCRVVDKAVGPGVAEAGLRRCLEGAQLLNLPIKGGKAPAPSSDELGDNGDDWEAWGVDDDGEALKETGGGTGSDAGGGAALGDLGLWEVERRLFADNESAREVLEALGLEVLSESEGRAVLGRRVELAG